MTVTALMAASCDAKLSSVVSNTRKVTLALSISRLAFIPVQRTVKRDATGTLITKVNLQPSQSKNKRKHTRTVNILNSSSSVYRPLGFSFVFNGKPIYVHTINFTLPPEDVLLSRTSLSATKRVVTALMTSFTMSTYFPLTFGYLSQNPQSTREIKGTNEKALTTKTSPQSCSGLLPQST